MRQLTALALLCSLLITAARADAVEVGVFYYPGWKTAGGFWKDIQGLPGSRSPGTPWPDREPMLGYYPEEQPWVAEKQIDQAARYGIDFFAYDWYWDGKQTVDDHAVRNYLAAPNRAKLRFCILWANHSAVPASLAEYDGMVDYWITAYFRQPTYYRIDGKPVVFIFSYDQLDGNAKKFGQTIKSLLARANAAVAAKGLNGVYFVLTANGLPNNDLEGWLAFLGFSAYTGWNYAETRGARVADYDLMVDAYLDYYRAAAGTARKLPYIVPASPGWDSRPWFGVSAVVRSDPTPEKFERMLLGAKKLLDDPVTRPKVLMIEAWNEFGEGSYIEPTKKWGFRYLEALRKIFKPAVK